MRLPSLPPPPVNIHDITVASVYRGRGVATNMLAHVEHRARTRGAGKLTLEVLEGNQSAARLYATNGFAVHSARQGVGRIFLQKWLG